MTNNDKYSTNLKKYFLWLPFSGVILFLILSVYYFVYQKEAVTSWRIISILIPLIGSLLFSLPFNLIFREAPPYLKGRFKYVSILIIIASIGIIFSQKDNFNIQSYTPQTLNTVLANEEVQYLIFSSDNCPTCVDMKPSYRKIANKNKDLPIYYIDLTDTSFKADPKILEQLDLLGIEKIPTLIQVKGGIVEKNLIGMQSMDMLGAFFEN